MASQSLKRWKTTRRRELDQIALAHQSLGGTGRGRRSTTQQLNYAYAVLLASQFQGFCRDLHSESVESLTAHITPPELQVSCRKAFVENRKLDRGNANSGNIGSDFRSIGLKIWNEVNSLDQRNPSRKQRLDDLIEWRNAIAHQHFSGNTAGTRLRLDRVRTWRIACNRLAESFDEALRRYIETTLGKSPW